MREPAQLNLSTIVENFFSLEMNTRIQVEHPVSEIRGGIDIVKEQIKIASKGKTSLKQSDINFQRTRYRM